jgi:multidrug efflux pump subunit AcrB
MGVLAAAGVVVNDTLVLIDRVNSLRDKGFSRHFALTQAGRDRFRPIFLTTMTTFVGLTPLMMEQSTQAQFLIPMASALAFGVMAASVVTLIMTPCVYSMGDDIRERMKAGMGRLLANKDVKDS